ncbi:beta-L-arabinofuranosidase domain-containing protein [Prevotella sp. E2-28]|uniref:beta-L-arabinofuranosidase domain-containing protein n=1 Tax=Prevotella sp. E2-28 TaxID=2913620 RepID=UPI001ED9F851|nr:beta-L-arabinofuranosidase domain-containing protein [Prevotella sp. E2-28]UKK53578.1 glycoside hydrolase family 127 protein [Prevotella sp. E2-28]
MIKKNGHSMKMIVMTVVLSVLQFAGVSAASRSIVSVKNICVEVPVGNAPRLPYQLWVEYSDGKGEYRQVKWTNTSLDVEQEQADASRHPAGSTYEVRGFIVGDNTTSNGYPVKARVNVVKQTEAPALHPVAQPLPLTKVQLTGENRLTHNRDLDIDNLLSLDPKQQLYNYYDTYGIPTTGCPVSDGWDSPTTKLKGHGTGHYLSAMAMAYASCQDKQKKALLQSRIALMLDEMRCCQERTFVWSDSLGRYFEARDVAPEAELRDLKGSWKDFDAYKQDYRHYGYGYMNAIPPQHCVLIEMYRPYNNEDWVWAPYYTVHKQLAGLIDIANIIDDKAISEKALIIARDMGLWVWNRLHYRTYVKKDGTQAERRERPGNRYEMWNMYIAGEVGGMAESLARLSMMVSDKEQSERLLEAATCFDSPAFFDPLARHIDAMRTRHANQHIPMITGALKCYEAGADTYYYHIAQNFWHTIQGRYRYAMGGVGNGEMFRLPYTQMLSMANNPEPTINETCCAYNLAKLTKDLNTFNPDDASYMDYYERLLYNQLVGSINPHQYQVLYQYAVGLDASKPWGNETPQSTCCGGTGAENHVKYQEATYFVNDNTLWVALYLPTVASWDAQKTVIRQECQWPAEKSIIRIQKGRGRFAMKLRVPYWATEGFDIKLNGKSIATHYQPSSYVEIPLRKWSKKDVVEVIMPFTRHLDYTPDKLEVAGKQTYSPMWTAALMQGPLVMAAKDVKTWDEATIHCEDDWNRFHFVPDYDADRHVTHYFRLDAPVPPATEVDTLVLRQTLAMAQSRIEAQQAWNALTVKVPEHTPWASHGYARMMEQYQQCAAILTTKVNPVDAEKSLSKLNAALTAMRPGNLAEMEDMEELKQLMKQVRELPRTDARRDALRRAERVARYVTDGSGTKDMIDSATNQLKDILK